MTQTKNNKLGLRDIINVGIYTVIYFLMVALAALFCVFLLPVIAPKIVYPYSYITPIAALFCGSVYMLMVSRVQKFGAITLMAGIFAIFFLFIFPYASIFSLALGLIADLIAKRDNYKNKKSIFISYLVFSLNINGPTIPMYFFQDYYRNVLIGRGRTEEQIAQTLAVATPTKGIIIILLTILCAAIGGYIGQKLMKKHFEKAGIV